MERIKLHDITHMRDDHYGEHRLLGWDDQGRAWECCVDSGKYDRWDGWRRDPQYDFPEDTKE